MKNLLLFAFAAFSISASAQFTVWEDDFNDGDITDWTVWDLNADGQSWQANKNIQIAESGAIDFTSGTHDVMAVYAINLETGGQLIFDEGFPGYDFEWAASPAIDLSLFAGEMNLVINAQTSIYDGSAGLSIYASTSPEMDSFELVETVTIVREPIGSTDEQFNDYFVDITEYAGEETFYFAVVSDEFGNFIGHEIDNLKITATEVAAGLDDVAGKATVIAQNPVSELLQLQIGTRVNSENLKLQVYNVTGMLVKEAGYDEAGVSVTDLAGGMYFLILNDGMATETLKFLKK